MARRLVVLFLFPVVLGIIFVDRSTLDFDKKLSNWSITYFHDQTGNSVVNISFQTYVTVSKAFLYIKANAAIDRNDKEYQLEVLNTVIDTEKFLKGMQGHFIVRNFLVETLTSMDFEPKFPLPAVS